MFLHQMIMRLCRYLTKSAFANLCGLPFAVVAICLCCHVPMIGQRAGLVGHRATKVRKWAASHIANLFTTMGCRSG